jgi:hypothetical protein
MITGGNHNIPTSYYATPALDVTLKNVILWRYESGVIPKPCTVSLRERITHILYVG